MEALQPSHTVVLLCLSFLSQTNYQKHSNECQKIMIASSAHKLSPNIQRDYFSKHQRISSSGDVYLARWISTSLVSQLPAARPLRPSRQEAWLSGFGIYFQLYILTMPPRKILYQIEIKHSSAYLPRAKHFTFNRTTEHTHINSAMIYLQTVRVDFIVYLK